MLKLSELEYQLDWTLIYQTWHVIKYIGYRLASHNTLLMSFLPRQARLDLDEVHGEVEAAAAAAYRCSRSGGDPGVAVSTAC